MRLALAVSASVLIAVGAAAWIWRMDRRESARARARAAAGASMRADLDRRRTADPDEVARLEEQYRLPAHTPLRTLADLGVVDVTSPEQAVEHHQHVTRPDDPLDITEPAGPAERPLTIGEAREYSPSAGAPPRQRPPDDVITAAGRRALGLDHPAPAGCGRLINRPGASLICGGASGALCRTCQPTTPPSKEAR